uniref:Uncharacterized protein n=1 Tax=Mola mola TaxID=94237 RepID=A0A3Q3XF97_MOLML
MDAERSDGGGEGGDEPEVVDEFACAGMLRGSLTSLHSTVERIFGVMFDIGVADVADVSPVNNGQIWLKLQGQSNSVKLFVKGVVNQEEQQEVSYPGVLHCVFCGARGLFMDCLRRSTSAHIVVGSIGSLLISGLAEPVVRAYSLITDLVDRYEGTQSRRADPGDRSSGESLDSRRAFKTLVENWEDRHILDLLVLPGSVKEILLDLVKESGVGSTPRPAMMDGNAGGRSYGDTEGKLDSTIHRLVGESRGGSKGGGGRENAVFATFEVLHSHGVHRGRCETWPPVPIYTSTLEPPHANFQSNKKYGQSNYWSNPSPSKSNQPTQDNVLSTAPQSSNSVHQAPQPPIFTKKDSSPTRLRERQGFTATSSVVVTGEQRFLEGLQMPFDLQLTDEPGDPNLRTIVIDGSNVAWSHGLGQFFSCRGIALAVQHFWDRGHRKISAFLPQWRQKSDPKSKGSNLHILTIFVFFPGCFKSSPSLSACFLRFMLKLAQKTKGVIVTNDNLRDLLDESPMYRDIIKKSLLQYTFVGDHFMLTQQQRQCGASGADRSMEETASLREQLCQVFADQDSMVALVLQCNPSETDINVLSGLILEQH